MIHRAERLIVRIMAKDVVRGMRPKVLKGNKRWLSYRVNRKYRLLVRRECNNTGPFYCLSHNDFDHWVNRQ
ncbi:hypothetical protein [Shewanella algae]|uniref:ParE family toxin-like protein n=2 Tax=Shewanella TaxID=22 RepID=UPI003D0023EC